MEPLRGQHVSPLLIGCSCYIFVLSVLETLGMNGWDLNDRLNREYNNGIFEHDYLIYCSTVEQFYSVVRLPTCALLPDLHLLNFM